MKCGPDECPIVAFSDLTPAEQRVGRKREAERLYKQGFTEAQIAKQFGVAQSTITEDLRGLSTIDKPSRPKGGRPKGSTKPRKYAKIESRIASAVIDEGKTHPQVRAEFGVSDTVVRHAVAVEKGRREAEPTIDRSSLSMTAQQKLDLAIKQATRKLEVEIEQQTRAKVWRWLTDDLLPNYRKKEEHYNIIISHRKGIMKRPEYRSILSCLHPDRIQDEHLKKRFAHAFNLFTKLEKLVLDEKESPTDLSSLPKTVEELMKRRAEYDARRAAERAAKRSNSMTSRR